MVWMVRRLSNKKNLIAKKDKDANGIAFLRVRCDGVGQVRASFHGQTIALRLFVLQVSIGVVGDLTGPTI